MDKIKLQEGLSQPEKVRELKALTLRLKQEDKASDKVVVQRSGSFVIAAFSTAITIVGLPAVPAAAGGALIGACLVGAGGTLLSLAHELWSNKDSQSKILAMVLRMKPIDQWVKLWEKAEDAEIFLMALEYATHGEIVERNGVEYFRHDDGKHPFDVAAEWILGEVERSPAVVPSTPQKFPIPAQTELH